MATPWYTKLPDIAHRLTVVGLVGFTLYMTAGVGYTLYQNGKAAEERLQLQKAQKIQEAQQQDETK